MAYQFKHLPHGSAIGTGTYVFRHYGNEVVAVYPPEPDPEEEEENEEGGNE